MKRSQTVPKRSLELSEHYMTFWSTTVPDFCEESASKITYFVAMKERTEHIMAPHVSSFHSAGYYEKIVRHSKVHLWIDIASCTLNMLNQILYRLSCIEMWNIELFWYLFQFSTSQFSVRHLVHCFALYCLGERSIYKPNLLYLGTHPKYEMT